jgi:sporulation protein YlmC with PRC-barrel domain
LLLVALKKRAKFTEKEDKEMKKTVMMSTLVLCLSLGLVASSSYAAGRTGGGGFMMFNSSDLIGSTVRDSHGEFAGVVEEVRVDSGGHAFAVINHGDYDLYGESGINTPIPLEALQISKTTRGPDRVVLKTDMEHFDTAPYVNPLKKETRQNEANIYEYYGIEPYWMGSGTAGTMGKGKFMELNSLNLVGAAVENSYGKVIGIVDEVMVDSKGDAFAIVNHGDYDLYGDSGVNTPVPIQELRISRTKGGQDIARFKIDTEHLDFAPYLDPFKTNSRQYEANIYEYYGITPAWSRSGK